MPGPLDSRATGGGESVGITSPRACLKQHTLFPLGSRFQIYIYIYSFDLLEPLVRHQEVRRALHLPDQADPPRSEAAGPRGGGRDGEPGVCVLDRLYLPHHFAGCWRLPHRKRPEAPTEAQERHLARSLGKGGSRFRASLAPIGSGPPPGQTRLPTCPFQPARGTMKVWTGRALLGPGFLARLWPAPPALPHFPHLHPSTPPPPRLPSSQRRDSGPRSSPTGQVLWALRWSSGSSVTPKTARGEVIGSRCSEEWVKNKSWLFCLLLPGHPQSGGRRGREKGANLNLKKKKKSEEKKKKKKKTRQREFKTDLFCRCPALADCLVLPGPRRPREKFVPFPNSRGVLS